METSGTGIDGLLRQALAGPVPSPAPDFERRLLRELRRGPGMDPLWRGRLLAGYGLASALASAVILRGQGLGWGATAGMTLAPFALLALGPAWRAMRRPEAPRPAS